jgi:hypothetical protein
MEILSKFVWETQPGFLLTLVLGGSVLLRLVESTLSVAKKAIRRSPR